MKLQAYIIIAVGIMVFLNLGGVETGSNKVLTFLQFNQNNTNVNPDISITDASQISSWTTMKNFVTNNGLYFLLLFTITAIGLFSLIKFSALTISWQPDMKAALAIFAVVIWTIFALDVYSIVTLIGDITGNAGWIFQVIRLFLVIYLIAFAISLIKFASGGAE